MPRDIPRPPATDPRGHPGESGLEQEQPDEGSCHICFSWAGLGTWGGGLWRWPGWARGCVSVSPALQVEPNLGSGLLCSQRLPAGSWVLLGLKPSPGQGIWCKHRVGAGRDGPWGGCAPLPLHLRKKSGL